MALQFQRSGVCSAGHEHFRSPCLSWMKEDHPIGVYKHLDLRPPSPSPALAPSIAASASPAGVVVVRIIRIISIIGIINIGIRWHVVLGEPPLLTPRRSNQRSQGTEQRDTRTHRKPSSVDSKVELAAFAVNEAGSLVMQK